MNVIAGVHSHAGTGLMGLCKVGGSLSYPLYITHYMYIYADSIETRHSAQEQEIHIALLLASFVIFFAWVAVKFFDEPIRTKLRRSAFRRGTSSSKEDTMQIRYAFVDAFTEHQLVQNPVAIVPHAETLDEPTMRRIAGELNQVATTFILPPKNDFADWSLRSFTTAGHEVFGAGHNSLGAWWWLAESGNLMLGEGRNHFTQEIGGELLPVEVRCQHSHPVAVALTHMSPVYGAVCDDLPKLADALGVEDEDIMLSLPAQVVSTGIAHLLVPVIDREIVAKAQPDSQRLRRILQAADGEGCYLYCLDDSELPSSIAHARFFNLAQGVVEEAATATAAVPLACLLLRYGIAGNRKSLFIEQGYEMKRPCVLEVEVEKDVLRLAGRAITVMEGMLSI